MPWSQAHPPRLRWLSCSFCPWYPLPHTHTPLPSTNRAERESGDPSPPKPVKAEHCCVFSLQEETDIFIPMVETCSQMDLSLSSPKIQTGAEVWRETASQSPRATLSCVMPAGLAVEGWMWHCILGRLLQRMNVCGGEEETDYYCHGSPIAPTGRRQKRTSSRKATPEIA